MLVIPLILGCASDQQLQPDSSSSAPPTSSDPSETSPEDEAIEEEEESPSEYIYDEPEEDEPLLSVGEVEESIRSIMEVLTWVDPQELTSTYEGLRVDNSDDSCPYYYTDSDGEDYYGYQYWYDTCTADNGTAFSGYGYSYYYDPYISGSYIYDDSAYASIYGSITDRLGDSLDISGSYYHYSYGYTYSDDRYGYAYLIGDARWSSEDAEGSWMSQEYSLSLYYSWSYYPSYPGFAISISGSLSGLEDEQVNSALLDDFYLYSASIGSECEAEPSGTVSVRDEAGEWYHVYFQGPAWSGAAVFPPDCDGCGQVYYRGEYLGDVCPDFSPITQWETRPWNSTP